MHATFDETVDGDGFVDVVVYEGLLEDFEVLDVFVFIFRVELHGLDFALTQRAYTLTLLSGTSTRDVVSIEHRFGAWGVYGICCRRLGRVQRRDHIARSWLD